MRMKSKPVMAPRWVSWDETAVFYLRSRGLGEAEARRLLVGAFCRGGN